MKTVCACEDLAILKQSQDGLFVRNAWYKLSGVVIWHIDEQTVPSCK